MTNTLLNSCAPNLISSVPILCTEEGIEIDTDYFAGVANLCLMILIEKCL